jgi:hypothetical protein
MFCLTVVHRKYNRYCTGLITYNNAVEYSCDGKKGVYAGNGKTNGAENACEIPV